MEIRPTVRRNLPGTLLGLTLVSICMSLSCGSSPDRASTAPDAAGGEILVLPPDQWVTIRNSPVLALSPDGVHVALTGGPNRLLYLRPVDGAQATPVPGTEGAASPFFSPDGRWVGFLAGGKLMKAPMDGRTPVTVCDAPTATGATWAGDDNIVFDQGGLWTVPAAGGTPQPLTRLADGETSHAWPDVLPGATAVLFTNATSDGWNYGEIVLQDIGSGERRTLVEKATFARYVPTGHLLYVQGGVLMAAPFDLATLKLTGAAVGVVRNVMESSAGAAHYSSSASGSLLYAPGGILGGDRKLVLVDRQGNEQYLDAPERRYGYGRLSPDGETLAIQIDWPTIDIWLYRFSGDSLTQFTTAGAEYPWWTPDGTRITFFSSRSGVSNIFWKPADGAGDAEQLTRSAFPVDHSFSWSPDARTLAFSVNHPETGMDIWIQPHDAPAEARPYLATPNRECCPVISPDGRSIAYLSNQSGQAEVYLSRFPGPARPVQVSANGGIEPLWSRDGKELFYWSNDHQLMAVDILAGTGIAQGTPHALFGGTFLSAASSWRTRIDVTPDGSQFFLIRRGPLEDETKQLRLIPDWFDQLTNRVSFD